MSSNMDPASGSQLVLALFSFAGHYPILAQWVVGLKDRWGIPPAGQCGRAGRNGRQDAGRGIGQSVVC